jgi:hypothetical protein
MSLNRTADIHVRRRGARLSQSAKFKPEVISEVALVEKAQGLFVPVHLLIGDWMVLMVSIFDISISIIEESLSAALEEKSHGRIQVTSSVLSARAVGRVEG